VVTNRLRVRKAGDPGQVWGQGSTQISRQSLPWKAVVLNLSYCFQTSYLHPQSSSDSNVLTSQNSWRINDIIDMNAFLILASHIPSQMCVCVSPKDSTCVCLRESRLRPMTVSCAEKLMNTSTHLLQQSEQAD